MGRRRGLIQENRVKCEKRGRPTRFRSPLRQPAHRTTCLSMGSGRGCTRSRWQPVFWWAGATFTLVNRHTDGKVVVKPTFRLMIRLSHPTYSG